VADASRRAGPRRCLGLSVAIALLPASTTARPVPAGAEEVSRQELESLAGRATGDPVALDRLRRVDRVDGRPVDLRRALDAPGPEAADRARVLAGGTAPSPTGAGSAADVRRDARSILDEPRFQARKGPRPFAGALRRLGGWFRPVGEPIGRLAMKVADNRVGQLVLASSVVILATLVCVRVARRRTATNLAAAFSSRRPTSVDPAELERQADAAEGEGQLDRAFRLRFQAGLLRLHDAGRLRLRASTTTGEVLRTVPSATLGELATTLEEIVYGGRPARAPDLDAARSGWARVLEEIRR
jgi:Domain of unknown function (DUF4129)